MRDALMKKIERLFVLHRTVKRELTVRGPQLVEEIRRCGSCGTRMSLRQTARACQLSAPYLHDVIRGRRLLSTVSYTRLLRLRNLFRANKIVEEK